jgi:hypothetical protein
VASELRSRNSPAKIIILTMHDSKELERAVKAAGVQGYVIKTHATRDLITAIQTVIDGDHFFTFGDTPSKGREGRQKVSSVPSNADPSETMKGTICEYYWAEFWHEELTLPDVVRALAACLRGLVALNTSWDSGTLDSPNRILGQDWSMIGRHAISPLITDTTADSGPAHHAVGTSGISSDRRRPMSSCDPSAITKDSPSASGGNCAFPMASI